MLNVPIFNEAGSQVGSEQLDEQLLGGAPNLALLKQAVVMYRANQRQGTFQNLSRGMVEGSTRKLYKQKGTGHARAGSGRAPQRRGGGRAFAKKPRDYRQDMPKQMRRLARNHAVLAKLQSNDMMILDGVKFEAPKTKRFAAMLTAAKVVKGCVVATDGIDATLFKSGRNIPKTRIMPVAELNAYEVLAHRKLIFTRAAFDTFRSGLSKKTEKAAGAAKSSAKPAASKAAPKAAAEKPAAKKAKA